MLVATPYELRPASPASCSSVNSSAPSSQEQQQQKVGSSGRSRATEGLRLPELRPELMLTDQELELAGRRRAAAAEAMRPTGLGVSSSSSSFASSHTDGGGRGRLSSGLRGRQPTSGGLEDFLDSGSGKMHQARKSLATARPRPTQRQPIDDETAVPPEIFEQMLKLGSDTRARATHMISFAPPNGARYLRRHDAPARKLPGLEAIALHSRPAFACTSEISGVQHWGVAESVPMQIS